MSLIAKRQLWTSPEMNANPRDKAFQRHPRPQLPTKAALLLESRQTLEKTKPKTPSREQPAPRTLHDGSSWSSLKRLGDLVQGNRRWHIEVHKGKMSMLRKSELDSGRKYLEKVKPLAHINIAKLEEFFEDGDSLYFRFEYTRFTLEEVLNVHLRLEEVHILSIACSVFQAIKHMHTVGIIHNAISPGSIRICGQSGRIVLSDLEDCTFQTAELSSNVDLELLGFTLLECMEGAPSRQLRNGNHVRNQRGLNKIFGLENGEKWAGQKLLIDFLDDLFNKDRSAIAKLDRPHDYVSQLRPEYGVLIPFLELVPLECFAHWRPAAQNVQVGQG